MIASITGRLTRKASDYLIVDVSGVGYQVQVPLSTYYNIPDNGGDVCLQIHTHLREDSLNLFGFLTQAEKDAFLQLMSVSGIGPKLALAVLSSMSVGDVVSAIQSSDDTRLCTIPGIGKKTAARMILELKDKIKRLMPAAPAHDHAGVSAPEAMFEDAVSALVNLGYKKSLAEEVIRRTSRLRGDMKVEELIRDALTALMKK